MRRCQFILPVFDIFIIKNLLRIRDKLSILKSEHTSIYCSTLYFWDFFAYLFREFFDDFSSLKERVNNKTCFNAFFFLVPAILLLFSKCPLMAHLLKEVLCRPTELPWRLSAYPGHSQYALNTLFRSPTPSWKEFNPCLYLWSLPFHRHRRMLVQQAAQANHTLLVTVHHTMTNEISLLA